MFKYMLGDLFLSPIPFEQIDYSGSDDVGSLCINSYHARSSRIKVLPPRLQLNMNF